MGEEMTEARGLVDELNRIVTEICVTTNIGHINARINILTPIMLVPTSPFIPMKRHVGAAIERWIRWG